MDALGWLWWLVSSAIGLVWSLVWFLLGGWVATLAQLGVVVLVIFGYKYGWQRAPQELLARLGGFGRFAWAWVRAREPAPPVRETTPPRRKVGGRTGMGRQAQPGDVRVNISTVLTLAMFAGLWLLTALK